MKRVDSTNHAPSARRRRSILGAALATCAVASTGAWLPVHRALAEGATDRHVPVYRNPGCGCCGAWVTHLRDNGFVVELIERPDVIPDKRRFGVPEALYSCHTARVAGYTVEGHVPAADIERLIAERPDAAGLAVPGMPHGSPGMETGRVDPYAVLRFDADGKFSEYNRY